MDMNIHGYPRISIYHVDMDGYGWSLLTHGWIWMDGPRVDLDMDGYGYVFLYGLDGYTYI